jgi:D-lactate dehydrogenase
MALMQIFRLLRNTYAFDARVAKQDFRWAGLQSREIYSVMVGIIGVGRIGGTLAKLLDGLGVTVLGYDVKPNPELTDIVTYVDLPELLAKADVVSLHVDLNPTSENLLSAERLAGVKEGLLLVNASRGPVVDTDALIAGLESGQIAAAALDTVDGEGPIFNNDWTGKTIPDERIAKLLAMENVILTPHVAFFTNIAVQNMVDISLDDAITIANNGVSEHEI